ncbi:hypothetical protein BDZ97DRAFT_1840100 [Flammula alnicola]|nr:hypothetical protein BDZ97DRAFT_1840100 [Flammula alnicola]
MHCWRFDDIDSRIQRQNYRSKQRTHGTLENTYGGSLSMQPKTNRYGGTTHKRSNYNLQASISKQA